MTEIRAQSVDVVVIGGGPTGSAAVLWCARSGLAVMLVEREWFPRHRPGETLPPAAEVLFGQLGVADAVSQRRFLRHEGIWAEWAGPRRFTAFGSDADGPWRGFQAPRDQLDRLLLDAAIGAGVVVEQPARAARVLLANGRVAGIATAGSRISATWVVDASGGQHWLARRLSIPRRLVSPRLIARYGYARGQYPIPYEGPELVSDESGWTWTAQIGTDLYHWTRLSFAEHDPRRDKPPPAFSALTPLAPPRGADVSWRIVERPAGPGYLCVGDAASVLDPASSHGVLKALMSGMMAGHVITESARGAVPSAIAIRD
ncbi:MAG: tryptophan 7-halogenase, partial [Gemmatimonadaceae bacterium]